jgi:hypothetical protein
VVTLDMLAVDQALGPVKIGASLDQVGNALGIPDYWGFSGGRDKFLCYFGYGPLEVHFLTEHNMPRVFFASVRPTDLRRRSIHINPDNRSVDKWVLALPTKHERSFARLKLRFQKLGFAVSTDPSGTFLAAGHVINVGALRLCFNDAGELRSTELVDRM